MSATPTRNILRAIDSITPRDGMRFLAIALAYFVFGKLGLLIPYVGDHITLIWPPTGIAVAGLFCWGLRHTPAVFVGSVLVNMSVGLSLALSSGIGLGNSIGPAVAVWVLRRLRIHDHLEDTVDIFWFLVVAVGGGMMITASNGVGQLAWADIISWPQVPTAWLAWWLGDAMGVLVIGTALISFNKQQLHKFTHGWLGVELNVLFILTCGVAYAVFCTDHPLSNLQTLMFAPLLLQLCLALRGGMWISSLGTIVVALIAIIGTVNKVGILASDDPVTSLVLVWSYVASVTIMTTLATTLTTRLHNTELRWRSAIEGSGLGVWDLDLDDDTLRVNGAWESMLGNDNVDTQRGARDWINRLHPDDAENAMRLAENHLLGTTERYQCEFRMRCKDGSWKWILGQGKVIERRSDGKPKRMIGTNLDISRIKLAESTVTQLRDFYANILDNVLTGVWVADRDDRIIYVNASISKIAGISPENIVGKRVSTDFPETMSHYFLPYYRRAITHLVPVRFEAMPMLSASGRDTRLSGWIIPLFENDVFSGIICTMDDVTEQYQAETKLQQAASVFSASREAIMISAPDGAIVNVNPSFTKITLYDPQDVIGQNPRILKSGRHDAEFYREMWEQVNNNGYWRGEIWNRRKNGEIYPARLTLSTIHDAKGNTANYVAMSEDISNQKATEEQIRRMAFYDALTGLPNRTLLQDRADQLFAHASRQNESVALMFIDLDHFKNINDSLGHIVGDELLRALARRLEDAIRQEDTVGRLGGDEFLLVANCEGQIGAARLAKKLLATVAEPVAIVGKLLSLTPSIGIALYPRDGVSFVELLKNADAALYAAKDAGRNLYHFFTPSMNAAALERLTLENDMRQALDEGHFTLSYQPVIQLKDGSIAGAEALIRWRHAEQGTILPERFIAVAEQTGMVARMGAWVLHEAARQARAWLDEGLPNIRVAVNISARQFVLHDLYQIVKTALEQNNLPPNLLELELTESVLAQNVEETRSILEKIQNLGVSLSIDDFGTGYSSLSYLKSYPISKLKIDRSFVRDLLHDANDRAIANTIVTLGHNLGMKIVAEGVEDVQQLEQLRRLGCDEAQGFLLGKPMLAEDFAEMIQERMPGHRQNQDASCSATAVAATL